MVVLPKSYSCFIMLYSFCIIKEFLRSNSVLTKSVLRTWKTPTFVIKGVFNQLFFYAYSILQLVYMQRVINTGNEKMQTI